MKNMKKLSRDHMYILSLLGHGPMDIRTLVNASFGTNKRIIKILGDLVTMNLIQRIWDKGGFMYKKV
jgi:hypothetical protein